MVDPPLKDWIFSKSDVVAIEYHTSYPYAGDPFYRANIDQQVERENYVFITHVPSIRFDGPHQPAGNSPAAYETLHGQRKAIPSRVSIDLTGSYDSVSRSGIATATITPEEALAGDWYLRMAIVQDEINYPAPNGINVHHHVFRRFLPDPTGTLVDLTTGTEQVVVTQSFTVDPAWEATEFSVVAFLQEHLFKTIDQGAILHVDDLAPVEDVTWGRVKALFR